jgi:hypothetical protein
VLCRREFSDGSYFCLMVNGASYAIEVIQRVDAGSLCCNDAQDVAVAVV